ncbi:lipoxygenase family protein [Streptomyces sp. NPDC056264]|uniref:lipoxygenase family protein n=1 Tax=Streptomyces sp. NPDC056264 TaxID=3345767 RepID=UPI003AACB8CB
MIFDKLFPPDTDDGPDLPIRRSDVHTRVIYKLAHTEASRWLPAGPDAAGTPIEQGKVPTFDVIPAVLAVPLEDEDRTNLNFAQQATFFAVENLPLIDDPKPWASREAATELVTRLYGDILPPRSVEWPNTTSDRAIELLAVQGLAAHRITTVADDPGGAAYVVDLTWMHGLPVRAPYLRYGACAYFGPDRRLLRIHTSHDDRTQYPGDPTWEHAKWTWRTSLFTAVTVADHLGSTHYLTSNLLVTTARETLPADHPLRRLIKAFTYGAVDINRTAAYSLSNEGGLAHRTFAFTYGGLSRLLLRGIETVSFESFPDTIARKGIEPLGDAFLYATDGRTLFDIFATYVHGYLGVYYPANELVEDPDVRAFWQRLADLAPTLGLPPLTRAEQLQEFLSQCMFWVTGGHNHVGGVVEYVTDPAFMGTKILPDLPESDAQSTIQVLNLTVSTGLEQPPLIGDYRHLFLHDEHRPEVIAVFDAYQRSLEELSARIAARNENIEQPYRTFDPVLLDVSVST